MNAKALVERFIDFPSDQRLMYTVEFSIIGGANGYLGRDIADVPFLETDTPAQIRTKVRNAIIARGAELGYTITSTGVGSLYQI